MTENERPGIVEELQVKVTPVEREDDPDVLAEFTAYHDDGDWKAKGVLARQAGGIVIRELTITAAGKAAANGVMGYPLRWPGCAMLPLHRKEPRRGWHRPGRDTRKEP